MKEWGWEPKKSLESSLEKTVNWFLDQKHGKWLDYKYND